MCADWMPFLPVFGSIHLALNLISFDENHLRSMDGVCMDGVLRVISSIEFPTNVVMRANFFFTLLLFFLMHYIKRGKQCLHVSLQMFYRQL